MRLIHVPVCLAALLLSSCGAGSLGIGFDYPKEPNGTAGGTGQVTGHFETKGAFNGKYTLVTVPGENVDECIVSAKDGETGKTIHIDTSDGDDDIALTVNITVNAAATFQVSCEVKATNDDDPSKVTNADAVVSLP